jgi:hypothetical protein
MTMSKKPSARPHTSINFAMGRYVAAANASPMAVGSADRECALNELVTYGFKLLVTESWNAFTKYKNQML